MRATLAAVLTFFLVLALSSVAEVPVTDRILGFAIALFIAANVRDSTPRQRLVTMAVAPLGAFAATTLAALLLPYPIASAAAVPALMALIAFGAARGPRYASIGIVALIAYMVGLMTRQPPETLPIRLVVLLLAAADAALIRLVLLPERPQAELARLRHAMRRAVDRVLDQIVGAITVGRWTPDAREALGREVYRLGEVVMLAQDRVAALGAQLPDQGRIWLHLLATELATERISRVALRDPGPATDRDALLAMVRTLHDGGAPSARSATPLAAALVLLGHVLNEPPTAAAPTPAAPPPATTGMPGLRPVVQTAVAAALAIVSGMLVSPTRWYWAAFAAYVMFQGTRSRGESVAKGLQFLAGTIAGVIVGTLVGTALAGSDLLSMAAIVLAVFLAFQANVVRYGMMVFWITIILGLVFGMLGYFPEDLLFLRLQEAAAGIACGVVVASFVLARRDYAATYDATVAFLHALGELVDGAVRLLLRQEPGTGLARRILAAEQRFHDLHALAESEQASHPLTRNEVLRRRLVVLGACEQWARELGQICLGQVALTDPALVDVAQRTAVRIDATLRTLIDRLQRRQPVAIQSDDATEQALSHAGADGSEQRAVRLLLRIEAALRHLSAR